MNRRHDGKLLLADVLAEAEPRGFRQGLLRETLRLAGRRRRVRGFQHATTALVVLGMLGTVIWRIVRPGAPVVTSLVAGCTTVYTERLSTNAISRTQPLDASCFIVSSATVAMVRTTPTSGRYRKFDDDELLRLWRRALRHWFASGRERRN